LISSFSVPVKRGAAFCFRKLSPVSKIAMDVVDDPVENGVFGDQVLPFGRRRLCGDDGGFSPIVFLKCLPIWPA
jgi:hypothetical protein